ncbi:MAG: hypothetical protein AAF657_07215 [Acidobacteriota bacterium]
MKLKRRNDRLAEQLRQQLKAGDPLPSGEEMPQADARRMRQVILAEAQPVTPRGYWQAAAVAAALTMVVGSAHFLSLRPQPPEPKGLSDRSNPSPQTNSPIATSESTGSPADRQIQFTTRGGTRVIWVLKSTTQLATQP